MANTCTSIERKEKSRYKREAFRERERERTRQNFENGKSKYGMRTYVCVRVYVADGGSGGDATGAGKNVLRTLDITGSNVTRSRRERERPAFRGAKRRGEQRVDGARWVSRLLTITIDLVLFYARGALFKFIQIDATARAIGRRERWFLWSASGTLPIA